MSKSIVRTGEEVKMSMRLWHWFFQEPSKRMRQDYQRVAGLYLPEDEMWMEEENRLLLRIERKGIGG